MEAPVTQKTLIELMREERAAEEEKRDKLFAAERAEREKNLKFNEKN